MQKINFKLKSFRVKVTLAFILLMFFTGAMSNFLIYKFALDSQFSQLRDKLKIIAQTAALMIDGDVITSIPLNRQGVNTAPYKIILERLRKIKETNKPIRYIYTLAKTDKEGIWQFVVDPDPESPSKEKKIAGPTSYPGDKYDASHFPEMLKAFSGPSADKKLEIDAWGVTLSGYAPVRDKNGKAVAVLGVDLMAEEVYHIQKEVHLRAILVLGLGILVSLVFGMSISLRITRPLEELVEATRRIAEGDLKYQVAVTGNDEIGELAQSFNKMAASLYESRKKLHSYFYHVIHSLVRVLEARDHYTRGHSEKVAEYAVKIAKKMGFPKDKIELLKETALLHDIGKLGIQESILNKKEKLNDEDWEAIHRHPIIGEGILRPVLLSKEMLTVIKEHHERYDGRGYPDHLSGQNINIFAQILSVADAYDAMTTARAYRPPLSKEAAIEEMQKNRGAQFNPGITDIFIQVLREENQGIK